METQFDELAKALARGVSRREAVRQIGGGLAGALLASLGMGAAWGQQGDAKCRDVCGRRFPPGRQRQNCYQACVACDGDSSRICRSPVSDNIACCAPGGTCCRGVCCEAGYACCNGQCTQLGTRENCRHCGEACPTGTYCYASLFTPPDLNTGYGCVCLVGSDTYCESAGRCVSTRTNEDHCGGCDRKCAPGQCCCFSHCVG